MENELRPVEKQRMIEALMAKPPKIGLVGISGVGKSSTINTMFKTRLPISHTVACTKEFRDVPLAVHATQGELSGATLQLLVCDAPGLGEDVKKDAEYLEMYKCNLPSCDVILWVTTARNRAIALDQMYLKQLQEFQDRIVFGVNQVDLVEPLNWPPGPIPSPEQQGNIEAIVEDRRKRFAAFLGRDVTIVPYSTARGFNLEDLFTSVLEHAPKSRKWVFGLIKNFRFEDFMPQTQKPVSSRKSDERVSQRRTGILDTLQRFVNRPVSDMNDLNNDELRLVEKTVLSERRRRQL